MEDIISPPFGGSINGALVPQGVALGFFISPPSGLRGELHFTPPWR